ncbi:MAG: UDP-N-acetylglucosamine 1-carboxyvinyltransferase [Planctomycetota bacterium]|jgi:UDP-N-acetylglucosamine 1-carboxyvinyltransferase
MSETAIVHGGVKLQGTVELIPNKNSFLPALAAALLSDRPVTYTHVPNTSDTQLLLQIFKELGATVEQEGSSVTVTCNNLNTWKVPVVDGKAIRASLLFAGPLLARFGKAQITLPGGCKLGFRGIAAHVENFQKLGIAAEFIDGGVIFSETDQSTSLDGLSFFSREASVTATENALLYMAGKGATTTICGAAMEPHVVDLTTLLADMGVGIEGAGTNRISVTGKQHNQFTPATFTSRPDFVDFCGYAVAAAITGGEIRIQNGNVPEVVDTLIDWISLFQVQFIREGNDIIISKYPDRDLFIDHHGSFPMAGPRLPKLYPRPWPGFPVDCIPMMIPLAACMSRGQILIKNWMYEDGLQVTRELAQMGASIFMASPGEIVVSAKDSHFSGKHTVTPPTVIQSVKAVFLAALAADEGSVTTIRNFHFLKRRYPDLVEKFTSLGARIEIIED